MGGVVGFLFLQLIWGGKPDDDAPGRDKKEGCPKDGEVARGRG